MTSEEKIKLWDYIIDYCELKGLPRRQAKRSFARTVGTSVGDVNQFNYKILCAHWFALTHKQELELEPMNDYINCIDRCTYGQNMELKMSSEPIKPMLYTDRLKETPAPRVRTEADDQRDYLLDRLQEIRENKICALREKFHMDEKTPTTVKELIYRITNEKYTLPSPEDIAMKEGYGYQPTSIIRWNDPAFPADPEGYKAAKDTDDILYQTAKDNVVVKSGLSALSAVTEYESA
jgi:hypothetical protein